VQRDDNVLEENHVLISQWDGKTTNDTGQDIQKLSSSIKLMVLMDKSKKAFVNGFSYHFSPWHQLGVELVKNILEIVSLDRLFGVEELKELLHELRRNINFERADFYGLVYDQL